MTLPDEPANPWNVTAPPGADQAPMGYPPSYPPSQLGLPHQAPPLYGYAPPYAYPPFHGQAPQVQGTNGLAIASLCCSIFGFLYGIPAILGIVFGFVARSQIKQRPQAGKGLAIAGIVVGVGWFVLFVIGAVLAIVLGSA